MSINKSVVRLYPVCVPVFENRICLTAAESIRASKYPALLYLSVWGEHQSDVVLVTLLGDHSNKQLPVLHCCI